MKLTGLNRDEIRVRDMSGLSAGFLTVESGYFPSCSSSRSLSEVALGVLFSSLFYTLSLGGPLIFRLKLPFRQDVAQT